MRLYVQGTGSLEFPLRLLNLLAQQGAVVEHVTMDIADCGYGVLVNTIAMPPERNTLIVEKIRSMVLVSNVVVLKDETV
tara:strand:- start:775 stop:1011 length:237 start_codon:yes stop_codon:yes gene_type:complete